MSQAPIHPAPDAKPRNSRTQAWLLIVVFFAPLGAAFLLYYGMGAGGWRPHGNTNRGDLITPARPLAPVALSTPDGGQLDPQVFRGKWTLVYIGDGQCDARCREALILTRQTRLALNTDMARVQRLFLADGHCCDEAYLRAEHVDLATALVDDAAGQQLLAAFPEGAASARQGRIYIVDPLGNLMMSYSPQAPRKALLEDLKKLLKLSHIG